MPAYPIRRFYVAAGLLLLCLPLWGQTATERTAREHASDEPVHLGYPQDWSSHHLVMPGVRTEDVMEAADRDPRHVYNLVMRRVAIENARIGARVGVPLRRRRRMKIDWSVSLENGYVPANQFPAKYQFGIGTENCNSDYALFGLTVTSGTQANLVGINNLYTTGTSPCNGGSPWVAFAYNTVTQTGGQIKTSPTLSTDGTKVAFIESTAGASYFHVLVLPNPIPTPPAQSGNVLSPLTPTTCTTPTTPGCMTTLTIESTATNSNSSPWVDYHTDTAYVGADNGVVYKITPVFGGGAPALVSTGGWPVTVSTQTNKVLTAPVVDDTAARIFIGDGYGYLYGVNLTNPGTSMAQVTVGWVGHGAGTGVVDPPIAVTDSANSATDQVFVFTGCSTVLGIGGAVSQIPANFTSSTTLTTSNTVDMGSASGTGDCTTGNLHSGAFDNAFWLNGSTSGHLIACGFVSGTSTKKLIPSNPKMYFFPFATHVITSTGSSNFVVNNTIGDECSPLTEFYDGTTDRLFFGVGSSTDGFLESSTITTSLTTPNCTGLPTSSCVSSPSALGGTSGIVIDNQVSNGGTNIYFSTIAPGSVNSQKCNVSGGTANPYCAVRLTQSALQ
ncbi:MAG TPA: hypothetical protein VNZ03_30045 [Terriglobales bacterium]|nr:hypothetical protein [Terriglobales bacterium]